MLNQFFDIEENNEDITTNEVVLETKKSTLSPFDFINHMYKGTKWSVFTESEQKGFSVFIVNRSLSMYIEFIDLISQLQHLTSVMPVGACYKMYAELLSKPGYFSKFIKSQTKDKYPEELMDYLKRYYMVSEREIIEYLKLLSKDDVSNILKKYGINDKDIKKLIKY